MKNNKLFSVLIALLVCLTVVVSVSAAGETTEDGLVLSLKASGYSELLEKYIVKTGETLTLDVIIEKNPGILAADFILEYDAEKFELVLDEEGNASKVYAENVSYELNKKGEVNILYGDLQEAYKQVEYPTTKTTGLVLKLTFKAKQDVDTDADFILLVHGTLSRNENGGARPNLIAGNEDRKNVRIVSSEHNHENYDKIEMGAIPSCKEDAKENDTYCDYCGEMYKEGAPLEQTEHNWVYDEENSKDADCLHAGAKVYNCSVCGEQKVETVAALGHEYGEWYIAEGDEATCGNYGIMTRSCVHEGCTEHSTKLVDPTGNHTWEIVNEVKKPTCTEKGINELKCSVCGETSTDEAVPALGHTEGEWKVTKEATTKEKGEETLYCSVCNSAMQTRSIDMIEKNNTVVIVIVVVVTLLAAASVAAYFVLKKKKA